MAQKPKKKSRNFYSNAERAAAATQVNEWRAIHPGMVTDAIAALGLDISTSNYHAWNSKLKRGKLSPPAKNAVTEFPLEAIPARANGQRVAVAMSREKPITVTARKLIRSAAIDDDDKLIAASLLEIAARLLKR